MQEFYLFRICHCAQTTFLLPSCASRPGIMGCTASIDNCHPVWSKFQKVKFLSKGASARVWLAKALQPQVRVRALTRGCARLPCN